MARPQRDDPKARLRQRALVANGAALSRAGDDTYQARVDELVRLTLKGALSTSDMRRLAQEWDISWQEAVVLQSTALGVVRQMQGNTDEVRTRLSSWLDAIARQAGKRKDVRGAAAAAKVFADVTGINAPKELNVNIDINDSSAVRAKLKAAVASHREVYRELLLEVYAEAGEAMVILPAPIQTTTSYPQPYEAWQYPDDAPSVVLDGGGTAIVNGSFPAGPKLGIAMVERGVAKDEQARRANDEHGPCEERDESTLDATSRSIAEAHSLDLAHRGPTPHEVAKLPWDE